VVPGRAIARALELAKLGIQLLVAIFEFILSYRPSTHGLQHCQRAD
jgi:hypothetical protein